STIEEFTGTFNSVVENVTFEVLNEMMNYNESKKSSAQAMRTIITDKIMDVNQQLNAKQFIEMIMNISINQAKE
ncbi:MAG: hypothetical protein EZS28_045224, partial [Streblomastix strix]